MSAVSAGIVAGATLLALLLHTAAIRILRRWACTGTSHDLQQSLVRNMTGPSRVIVP